jgi:hypothetical protein
MLSAPLSRHAQMHFPAIIDAIIFVYKAHSPAAQSTQCNVTVATSLRTLDEAQSSAKLHQVIGQGSRPLPD